MMKTSPIFKLLMIIIKLTIISSRKDMDKKHKQHSIWELDQLTIVRTHYIVGKWPPPKTKSSKI